MKLSKLVFVDSYLYHSFNYLVFDVGDLLPLKYGLIDLYIYLNVFLDWIVFMLKFECSIIFSNKNQYSPFIKAD